MWYTARGFGRKSACNYSNLTERKNHRMSYRLAIFDLDGTITSSVLGISNSIKYSLIYFGLEKDNESLKRHKGPALSATFREYEGDDEEKIQLAIKK